MASENEFKKKCGYCGESIPLRAGRCPYCGSILKAEENSNNDADFSGVNPDENSSEQYDLKDQINTRNYNSNFNQNYYYNTDRLKPLSNGMKVFLTVLFTILPGIGQLAGIIAAIVFMNAENDSDRKSFGVALLVASLIMFVLSCIGCFILALALSPNQFNIYR